MPPAEMPAVAIPIAVPVGRQAVAVLAIFELLVCPAVLPRRPSAAITSRLIRYVRLPRRRVAAVAVVPTGVGLSRRISHAVARAWAGRTWLARIFGRRLPLRLRAALRQNRSQTQPK